MIIYTPDVNLWLKYPKSLHEIKGPHTVILLTVQISHSQKAFGI